MTPDLCRAYARYNRWMNANVYDTAAQLSDEERKRDRAAFFGSIHNVLNHLLVADRIWLGRLTGRVPEPGFMGPDGIKSLDQELAVGLRRAAPAARSHRRRDRRVGCHGHERCARRKPAHVPQGTVE